MTTELKPQLERTPWLLLLLLLATASVADAKRPRPDAVTGAQTAVAPNEFQLYNEYASPESTYASERVVVHYVVLGIDAPPLNDDDHDGVPDYVERVGEAADRSLTYYERRGFHAAARRRRRSGFPTRSLHLAVRTGHVRGRAPCGQRRRRRVRRHREQPRPERRAQPARASTGPSRTSSSTSFSSRTSGAWPSRTIPTWILEGSASGIEARVYPELDDIVSSLQMRRWFSATAGRA